MINYVKTELIKRKSEWDDFSKVTGISTKTFYRIVTKNEYKPSYDIIERLFILLKKAA